MTSRVLGLFLRSLDDAYQIAQRAECITQATVHGFSVREVDARNDSETQVRQIREAMALPDLVRPRAILVNPVREAALQMLARDAARLGVGWVSLNRTCDYVRDLRHAYPSLCFFCVDPDQREIGRMQGRQFRALLPRGGEVFYIQGPTSASSARLRLAGVQSELQDAPVELSIGNADWSAEGGKQAMREWLAKRVRRSQRRFLVGAQNDSMAVGARDALLATRQVAAFVTGCDGLPTYGQRLVLEGQLTATVIVPSTTPRAVNEVIAVLSGGRPPSSDLMLNVESFPDLGTLSTVAKQPAGSS
ncbi:MAG: substrate-binding domain-containing protein [Polyangiaceae bacterium]|jgi:ribose transport system substrate-binding protein/inositol transport system substrate-binding protein